MSLLLILEILIWVAAIAIAAIAIVPMVLRKGRLTRRLNASATGAALGGGRLVRDDSASRWARVVEEVERRGVSLKDSNQDALTGKLMLAGFPQAYAVRAFVLVKLVLTLALALAAFVVLKTLGVTGLKFWVGLLAGATLGMYAPNIYVNRRSQARRREILNGFPDTLDLLLVCVEAGLGIDQAFARVATEMAMSHALLSRLLLDLTLELRAGRTRSDALRSLARRTGLPEVVSFVALLNQADKLGSSIGPALRIYSAEMREARRMRAEEKAARLPVILSVPIVFFLLPVIIGIVMLPAGIGIKRQFMGHHGISAQR